MTDLLRTALKGTIATHCEGDEKALLRQVGVQALQRIAAFNPSMMPIAQTGLPPLVPNFRIAARYILKSMSNNSSGEENPRIPFLLMAWLFIGTDNAYCLSNYFYDKHLIRHVVYMLLQIVCGGLPSRHQVEAVSKYAKDIRIKYVYQEFAIESEVAQAVKRTCSVITKGYGEGNEIIWAGRDIHYLIESIVRVIAPRLTTDQTMFMIYDALQSKVVEWTTLTEAEQLQIVREWLLLLLDDR